MMDSTNNSLAPQPCLLDNSKTNAAMSARLQKKTRNSGKSSRYSATALRRAGEFVCPEIREASAQLSGDRTPICSSSAATKTTSHKKLPRKKKSVVELPKLPNIMKSWPDITKSNV